MGLEPCPQTRKTSCQRTIMCSNFSDAQRSQRRLMILVAARPSDERRLQHRELSTAKSTLVAVELVACVRIRSTTRTAGSARSRKEVLKQVIIRFSRATVYVPLQCVQDVEKTVLPTNDQQDLAQSQRGRPDLERPRETLSFAFAVVAI